MIRKFRSDDMDRVMQLWYTGNIDAHDFIPMDYWGAHCDAVRDMMRQADIYVYEIGGTIQGFAGMTGNYLAGIFVDKHHRSMGIGQSLIVHIKEQYPSFTVEVYRENRRAIEFYLREGFSIIAGEIDQDTGKYEFTLSWSKFEKVKNGIWTW